jgi:DNA-binding MarR family transcriptional regulator
MYIQLNIKMKKRTKTTTPDLIAQDCIAVRMRLLNRVVSKVYDDALRPLGLKTSQLNILVVTARRGLVRPAEIRGQLKMDISTVSRNVDRMRAKGWIEVVEDEQDGRAHQLRLSAIGQRLLEKAKPAWDQAQGKVKELLGRDGIEAIMRGAERVRAKA